MPAHNRRQLSFTHIGGLAGTVHLLRKPLYGDGACRVGQEFQFIEVFLRLGLILLLRDKSHQHGRLGLGFRYYKFFHSIMLKAIPEESVTLFIYYNWVQIYIKFQNFEPIETKM